MYILYIMSKLQYLIQPYRPGSNSKSLVVVIPSDIVKEYKINTSTGFSLTHDIFGIHLQFVHAK